MHLLILSGGTGWHVQDLLRAAGDLNLSVEVRDFRNLRANTAGIMPGTQPDAVIVRTMPAGSLEQVVFRMDLLQALELRGIPVVNPSKSLEICIDKFLCGVRLAEVGLPVPPTIVTQSADDAQTAFAQLGGDVVVKPLFGSEGRGMLRVSDPELAWRTFRTLERTQSVLYLQKFIHHPGWDLRLFVKQGEVLAAMKRTSSGDWRTNVAQGATTQVISPRPEEIELALRAAKICGTVVSGVDLMYDENGNLWVIEVNAVPGWKALSSTTGLDIAREILLTVIK